MVLQYLWPGSVYIYIYTVNSLDITEFRYKGCNINCLEVVGENIHFDISGYFVISEFDVEGVDCILYLYSA